MTNKIKFMLFLMNLLLFSGIVKSQRSAYSYDSLKNVEAKKYSVENIGGSGLQNYCKSLLSVYKGSFRNDLILISSLTSYKKEFQVDCCNYLIEISSQSFNSKKHKITFLNNHGYDYLIDDKTYWGGDGTLPYNEINKFKVMVKGTVATIPLAAYSDLYEPNFDCSQDFDENGSSSMHCHTKVYESTDQKYLFILMQNSDGAGYYEVIFIFEDGKYLTRVIDLGF